MFFIFGISQGEKQLRYDRLAVCPCCGRYGNVSVWMQYTYFSLFFIPLFRWNRRYFIRMECCGASAGLDPAVGRDVAAGRTADIDLNAAGFTRAGGGTRRCPQCGYETDEDFQFCPKCGTRFS